MTLQKQPNPIDFLGNKPEFVIRATPYVTSGRTAHLQVRFLFLASGTLSLRSPHAPISNNYFWIFSVGSGGDDIGSLTAIPAGTINGGELIKYQLETKLKYHPEISKYYNVNCSADGNYCLVDIESWEPEEDDAQHRLQITATGGGIATLTVQYPIVRTFKPDYRISFRFEYNHRFNYLEKNGSTPEMFSEPSDSKVLVSCQMLEGLFGKPDMPRPLSDYEMLYKANLKVRMVYAEYYSDNDGWSMKKLRSGGWHNLFNGSIDNYNAIYNLPSDGNGDSYVQTNHAMLFAQRHGDFVFFDKPETEQYMYVANFTSSTAVVQLDLTGIPSVVTPSRTFNIHTDCIYRIGVSLEALGVTNAEDVISYKITLTDITDSDNPVNIGERTFERKKRPYGAHTFLLLNPMNLYETMKIDTISQEVATEGERQIYVSEDRYSTTDEQTVYKATTGYRTADELRLLHSAFSKQHNLMVDDKDRSYVWYIDIVPGSVTVLDENEDLINCEFQFRKRSRTWRRLARVGMTSIAELPNMSQAIIE
ncbi:MAG: hypothetical protein J5644_03765 [Bacteroidales bacterium]|nr:hypothetical protein [Bacteroidales bacterium]